MKPLFAFLSAALLMGVVPNLPSLAMAANRPSELTLHTLLNGEVYRDLNTAAGAGYADGGGLTLWTIDAGIGCNAVATGAVYEMHCNQSGYFCAWSDGGCSATIGSQTYGRPVKLSTAAAPEPYFFVTQADTTNATKFVCFTPIVTEAIGICALYRMR